MVEGSKAKTCFFCCFLGMTLRPAKESITWRSFVGIKRFRQQHWPQKILILPITSYLTQNLELTGFYGCGQGWSQVYRSL